MLHPQVSIIAFYEKMSTECVVYYVIIMHYAQFPCPLAKAASPLAQDCM